MHLALILIKMHLATVIQAAEPKAAGIYEPAVRRAVRSSLIKSLSPVEPHFLDLAHLYSFL